MARWKGVQRLILCRCAHALFLCQVRQKLAHFHISHFGRMPLVMENHKPPDPTGIGLFGSWTIVPKPDGASDPSSSFCRFGSLAALSMRSHTATLGPFCNRLNHEAAREIVFEIRD